MKKLKESLKRAAASVMASIIIAGGIGDGALLSVQAEDIIGADTAEIGMDEGQEETAPEKADAPKEPDAEEKSGIKENAENNPDIEESADKVYSEDNEAKDDTSDSETIKDSTGRSGADEAFTEEMEFAFDELPDNNELLAGYMDQLFYKDTDIGVSMLGIVGEKKLTNTSEKKLYSELKNSVEKIANGSRTSAIVEVSGLNISVSGWQASFRKVMSYLMMDCPYDLYWFDKSSAEVSASGYNSTVAVITVSFTVAGEYRGSGIYTTNSSKITAAKTAVSNAKAIVTKHASETDRNKLISYCREICDLVSYNAGAASGNVAYGNPWQLIWVFDKNPGTNVVCEGYAKAFQYLCDLSSFKSNTVCYTVTGVMSDGISSGNHMWNVVTINGANYLADVTNCDSGGVGSDGSLFLAAPGSGTVNTGYTFTNSKGRSVIYTYNSEMKTLLGPEILRLAGSKEDTEITLSLNGQSLKNNTTLKVTFNKKYTFKAAVTGNPGKVTWSTSNKKIATVNSNGRVSVKKKAGTVTITAKTADGETAKVKLKASKAAVKVAKVKITGSKTMSLKTKKTQTLKAVVSPASAASQKVTWKSSNKKVATVNSKGKVTAKKAGTVTITAAAKDGSKKKASIKIKVTK